MKALEVSVPGVIQVGPQCNHLYPWKERSREMRHTPREDVKVKVEAVM